MALRDTVREMTQPESMILVIVESPYAGDIERNTKYARCAMRDSLRRGEAPIASHLIYPQRGILREELPAEREWGINAGLAWSRVADRHVFYVDIGWSNGMIAARQHCDDTQQEYEIRSIGQDWEAQWDAWLEATRHQFSDY